MPATLRTAGLAWLLVAGLACASDITSRDSEFLRKALQQYPAADANHDGVLTESEARAFQARMGQAQQPAAHAPAARQATAAPDVANVSYGPFRANALDLWRPGTTTPAPVFVFFHGGGFMGGDKSDYSAAMLSRMARECPQNGIAFVSANYRLVTGAEAAPYPAPMLDGARVVQFLRARASEWNLDPRRIAIGGASAGANLALWVALHDDLAAPSAQDPVLRESSRVACVVAWDGQTSNDPDVIRQLLGGPKTDHPALLPFYGVTTREELATPAMHKLEEAASAVTHASKDDPPVLMIYGRRMTPLPLPETTDWGTAIHHPAFGQLLKARLDPLGVICQLYYGDSPQPMPPDVVLQFLKTHLHVAP